MNNYETKPALQQDPDSHPLEATKEDSVDVEDQNAAQLPSENKHEEVKFNKRSAKKRRYRLNKKLKKTCASQLSQSEDMKTIKSSGADPVEVNPTNFKEYHCEQNEGRALGNLELVEGGETDEEAFEAKQGDQQFQESLENTKDDLDDQGETPSQIDEVTSQMKIPRFRISDEQITITKEDLKRKKGAKQSFFEYAHQINLDQDTTTTQLNIKKDKISAIATRIENKQQDFTNSDSAKELLKELEGIDEENQKKIKQLYDKRKKYFRGREEDRERHILSTISDLNDHYDQLILNEKKKLDESGYQNFQLMSIQLDNIQDQMQAFKILGQKYLRKGDYDKAFEACQILQHAFETQTQTGAIGQMISNLDSTILFTDFLLSQQNVTQAMNTLDGFKSQNSQENDAIEKKKALIQHIHQQHLEVENVQGMKIPQRIKSWCLSNQVSIDYFNLDYIQKNEPEFDHLFSQIQHKIKLSRQSPDPQMITFEIMSNLLRIDQIKLASKKNFSHKKLLEQMSDNIEQTSKWAKKEIALLESYQQQIDKFEASKSSCEQIQKRSEEQSFHTKPVKQIVDFIASKECENSESSVKYGQLKQWRQDNFDTYFQQLERAFEKFQASSYNESLCDFKQFEAFMQEFCSKINNQHNLQIEYTKNELHFLYQNFNEINSQSNIYRPRAEYGTKSGTRKPDDEIWKRDIKTFHRMQIDSYEKGQTLQISGLTHDASMFAHYLLTKLIENPSSLELQKVNLKDNQDLLTNCKSSFQDFLEYIGYTPEYQMKINQYEKANIMSTLSQDDNPMSGSKQVGEVEYPGGIFDEFTLSAFNPMRARQINAQLSSQIQLLKNHQLLDPNKLTDLGWKIIKGFDESSDKTITTFDYLGEKIENVSDAGCIFDGKLIEPNDIRAKFRNESNTEKQFQSLSKWIEFRPSEEIIDDWDTKSNYAYRAEKLLQFGQYYLAIKDADQLIKYGTKCKYNPSAMIPAYFGYGYLLKSRALMGLQQEELARKILEMAVGREISDGVVFTQKDAQKWNKKFNRAIKQINQIKSAKMNLITQKHFDWIMANCVVTKFDARFIVYACNAQEEIKKIINDNILFAISDPEHIIKVIQDTLQSVLRVYKYLQQNDKMKSQDSSIVRHLIISAPGQGFQATFKEYNKDTLIAAKAKMLQKVFIRNLKRRYKFKKLIVQEDNHYEICKSKNKATQLDGTIQDCLQVQSYAKLLDAKQSDKIHIISEHLQISNTITRKSFEKAINKEILFFDIDYLKSGRKSPEIEIYYSGHGMPGLLKLGNNDEIFYSSIIEHLTSQIDKQMKTMDISLVKKISPHQVEKDYDVRINYEAVKWLVKVFIDACHSGSILDIGREWARKYQYKHVSLARHARRNKKRFIVVYFETQTFLNLNFFTSTDTKQEANDAGEGLGGKWTNYFLAKGMIPQQGTKIQGMNQDGSKCYQTTQVLELWVIKKQN